MLIIIKSIEVESWQDILAAGNCQIPPLGTVDEDGNYTSETDTDTTIAGTYKKNQAIMGAFEVLLGKTVLSFSDDPEKIDIQDLSQPKDYAKGYDTFSGSLEIYPPRGNHRVEGGALGGYDSGDKSQYPFKYFRWYEIWTMEEPNVKRLTATSCKMLVKHIGLILESDEMAHEAVIKHTIPITRRVVKKFPEWVAPSQTTLITADDLTGTPGAITDPDMHTRLQMIVASSSGWDADTWVKIKGYNIFDEYIEETITWTADGTKYTKNYFAAIDSLVYGTWDAGNLTVKDWDYKIQASFD